MTTKPPPGSIANPILLRHRRRQEQRNPFQAEEGAALDRVRAEMVAAGLRKFPVDLAPLERAHGVADVRVVPLASRGRLIMEERGIVVEIDERLPELARRFTHAHELGHLILEEERIARCQALGRAVRNASSARIYRVEHLCDIAAREMLLPESWVLSSLRGKDPSLDLVLRISDEAVVEPWLALQAIVALGLWKVRGILWSRAQGSLSAVDTTPKANSTYLDSLEIFDPAVLEDAARSEAVARGTLGLDVQGERIKYMAEAAAVSEDEIMSLLVFD